MALVTQAQPKTVVREAVVADSSQAGETPVASPARGYVLAVLAGVAVGAVGMRVLLGGKPPEQTRFVNFDPESTTAAMLATGWSAFERDKRGETWVWCAAESCTLVVEAHGQHDRLLRMRLWPARYPSAPPQIAAVNVNGIEVASMDLGELPLVWEVPTTKAMWKEGVNALRFDFTYTEAPAKNIPGSSDPRLLAASFDWLEIVPR
jgi:hypothetical protein